MGILKMLWNKMIRKETEDGYESQLATNYIGHFLLTHLLLPAITKAAADPSSDTCRIVNVSSCASYMGENIIDFAIVKFLLIFIL